MKTKLLLFLLLACSLRAAPALNQSLQRIIIYDPAPARPCFHYFWWWPLLA